MRFARTFIAYLVIFIVALPANAATGLGCQGELADAPAAEKHHSNHPMTLEDPHALHRGESDSDNAPPGSDSICDCCDGLCGVNGCAPAAAIAATATALRVVPFVAWHFPPRSHSDPIHPGLFRPPIV